MKKNNLKNVLTLLMAILLYSSANAQIEYQASNSYNRASTWSSIDTLGTAISFSSFDDESSAPVDFGFNFTFNGQSYNRFIINTNGFIKLDSFAPSSANIYYNGGQSTTGGVFNNTTAGDSCILAVFNTDLTGGLDTPKIFVYTYGSSGSRICIIQWKNFKDKHVNGTPKTQFDNISFQIKLYEGSNRIDYVYGPFSPSSNNADRFTVAVGIRGASAANQNILSVTKPSTTSWDQAVIQNGNYPSGGGGPTTHNTRNNILPDSGRTYIFLPVFKRDIDIKPIYSYGKVPYFFSDTQMVGASLVNNGSDTISNFQVILNIHGANQHADTLYVSSVLNPGDIYSFNFDKPHIPTNLGMDTFDFTVADDNDFNNNSWHQNVNALQYSYADWTQPADGGFSFNGFGATGDVLTKFTATKPGIINKVKLSFTTNNVNCKVGIWDVDTTTGLPASSLYVTLSNVKTSSNVTVNIPNISVGKTYFVGVRQQGGFGSGAIGLSYQSEDPIRDSTFYTTTPSNSANWKDFSLSKYNDRLMVEANYVVPRDLNLSSLYAPAVDTCTGGRKIALKYMIANSGSDTMDFYKDSIALYAKVVYPSGNTINYGPTYISTGMLNPGDSFPYTVTNQMDMSDSGWYQVSGYFTYNNDMDYSNDSLPLTIRASSGANSVAVPLGSTNLCGGDTLTMNAASSKLAKSFLWYKDGNYISNATDTIYRTNVAGDYFVETVNALGCSAYSDTITVTVNSIPSFSVKYISNSFCPGDSMLLTASTNDTIYSFEWTRNGTIISGKTDSIYYANQSGDYVVNVKNKISGCVSSSNTITLNLLGYPDTTLFSSKAIICSGDSVELSASNASVYAYLWMMNNKTIQNATDSFIYVSTTGTYSIELTSSAGCKASSSGLYIYVDSLPTAVAYSPNGLYSFCDKDTLVLQAYTVAGNTYQWSDNSGAINGATNSSYKATTSGDYSVEVTNSNGCKSVSSSVKVTVKSLPTPSLKNVSATSFCAGDSIILEANYTSGNTYQWILNGNNLQGKTDTLIYVLSAGNYAIREYMNGCTDTTSSVSISALPSPAPTITASGSTSFCQGGQVVLKVSSSLTLSAILWRKDGNVISGATTDSLVVNSTGDYNVYVTSTNGCSDTASVVTTVSVISTPTANVTANGSTTFCSNDSVKLSVKANGSITSIQWRKNGSNITGANSDSIYINTPGDYDAYVVLSGGCSATSNKITITVNPLASPVLSASGNTTKCEGDSIQLNLTATGSLSATIWQNNSSTISGANGNSYYAKVSGSYTVNTTSTKGCVENSNAVNLTFNPLPTATISYTKPILSVNAVAGNTYQWYLNGTKITGATSASYTRTTNGNYTIEITSSLGCKSTSAIYKVIDLSIDASIINQSINIFPNPSTGLFMIDLSTFGSGQAVLYITDINGKMIKQDKVTISANSGLHEVNLSNEDAGIYILHLMVAEGKAVARIIKK